MCPWTYSWTNWIHYRNSVSSIGTTRKIWFSSPSSCHWTHRPHKLDLWPPPPHICTSSLASRWGQDMHQTNDLLIWTTATWDGSTYLLWNHSTPQIWKGYNSNIPQETCLNFSLNLPYSLGSLTTNCKHNLNKFIINCSKVLAVPWASQQAAEAWSEVMSGSWPVSYPPENTGMKMGQHQIS